jgi:hypothetical protein
MAAGQIADLDALDTVASELYTTHARSLGDKTTWDELSGDWQKEKITQAWLDTAARALQLADLATTATSEITPA